MKFITKFTKNFFSHPVVQPASPDFGELSRTAGKALTHIFQSKGWIAGSIVVQAFLPLVALAKWGACKKHAEAWSMNYAGPIIRKKYFQRKKAYTLVEIPVVRKHVTNPERSRRAFTLIELPVARKRGFTLIELLTVIAIIGILATIIVISFINAQAKSRDSERRSEVQTIANALQAYHADMKSWLVRGLPVPDASYIGTGYRSEWVDPTTRLRFSGTGWFNFYQDPPNTYSKKSIATALVERKFLIETLRDPKMTNDLDQFSNPRGQNFQYMVYECPTGDLATPLNRTGLAVYAKLEHPNQEDTNVINAEINRTDSAKCDTYWPADWNGMNFITIVK